MQKATIQGMPTGMSVVQGHRYLFTLPQIDTQRMRALSDTFSLCQPIASVLVSRGFVDSEKVRLFLFSSYEHDVAHSSQLADAAVALDRLKRAIDAKEKILIFGDYDVDGISSSALLMSCLLPLGANINFFLPNRKRDGYGLSSKIVKRAVENNYDLIITVDNGITALDAAQTARDLGIDLIITDHHRPHGKMPYALAIVNPNRPDCAYPEKGLPGVGVIFKLICWLYEDLGLTLPEKAYELLLLGTVADVVPLVGENRFWVRHGLAALNKKQSYAVSVLMSNSKLKKSRISSLDIGFMIAPQINALGRLSDPRDGVKFLISSLADDVDRIGKTLWELNEARKEVERGIFEQIVSKIEKKSIDLSRENVIIASSREWPTGVIGLVAGRLMHQYGRPTLLFHEAEKGILKGSCRSIESFNMFDALDENKALLKTFGGHSFAAGLSLEKKNLPALKERLEAKVASDLSAYDLLQKIKIDAVIDLSQVNALLVSDLEKLEPFGHANAQPLFLIREVYLLKPPRLLKEKHVKCSVFSHGMIKQVLFFNRPELMESLAELSDRPFSLAAHVTVNEWNGRRSIELQGVDIAC